jgi:hypothetical protein
MKKRLYQATALAAGTLALSAVLRGSELPELIYDSARSGGAVWARATLAVGNLGLPHDASDTASR